MFREPFVDCGGRIDGVSGVAIGKDIAVKCAPACGSVAVVVGGAQVELAQGAPEGTAESHAKRVVDKALDGHELYDFVAVVKREGIE